MQHTYLFDVKLFATIRVKATCEAEARALVDQCAEASAGVLALMGARLGGGLAVESYATDGDHDLLEIDGEDV